MARIPPFKTSGGLVGRAVSSGQRLGHIVVFAPNWLGDVLMALPAVADVRRAFPAARLTLAGRAKLAAMLAWVDGVDDVVRLGDRHGWRGWIEAGADIAALERGRFDLAVLLPNSFHTAWLAWRAGIGERWGYRRDGRGALLTRAVRRPHARGHQAGYYQALTAALGLANGASIARVDPPAEADGRVSELLRSHGWTDERVLVGMAPGAAYGHAKRWLPERFAELAGLIADAGGQSVLVGSGGDRRAGEAIARALDRYRPGWRGPRAPLIDLIGQTDLEMLAGVMRRCRTFVSNDSGAMHLAAALGLPVVALFGASDERGTAPLAPEAGPARHTILTAEAWCRPCMLRECPIDHRCMARIGAERAFEAVRRELRAS